VIDHFAATGATSPGAAVTYQPQRHAERRALAYLTGKGVVRLTEEGRHWLDEEAADAWRRENAARTALMVGGAVAGVAALLAWRRYRRDRD